MFLRMLEKASGSTRFAVGALIYFGDRLLLVRKVRAMDMSTAPVAIEPEWDFPKGGIKSNDRDPLSALLRELKEELASEDFVVRAELPDLIFDFSNEVALRLGCHQQHTKMYLLEYCGDPNALRPDDDEVDRIDFVSKLEAVRRASHLESREYISRVFFNQRSDHSGVLVS